MKPELQKSMLLFCYLQAWAALQGKKITDFKAIFHWSPFLYSGTRYNTGTLALLRIPILDRDVFASATTININTQYIFCFSFFWFHLHGLKLLPLKDILHNKLITMVHKVWLKVHLCCCVDVNLQQHLHSDLCKNDHDLLNKECKYRTWYPKYKKLKINFQLFKLVLGNGIEPSLALLRTGF